MTGSRLKRVRLLLLAAMALNAAGCLGPKTIMEYREHATGVTVIAPAFQKNLPWTVGVRPIAAGKAVDQRLAYVDGDGVVRRYPDDGWAEPPATAVFRGLVDALRQSGAFADVDNAADMVRPDILVTGELRECVADFSADPPVARVTLAFSARVYRDRMLAMGRVVTKTVPVEVADGENRRNEPLRVAEALREAMRQAVADAAGLIVEQAVAWSERVASETDRETSR